MYRCEICGSTHNGKGSTCSKACSIEKGKQTMLKRWGVSNASQVKEFQEKRLHTFREKFGCDNPFQSEEVKNKIKQRHLDTKGYPNPTYRKTKNFENYNREFIIENFTTNGIASVADRKRLCEYFGLSDFVNARQTYKLFDIPYERSTKNKTSIGEMSVFFALERKYKNFVFKNNDRSVIENPETGSPLEIDIVVKKDGEIVCGVEYNGNYWHDKENPVKEELKTRLCAEKGFPLFHIWEDSVEEDLAALIKFLDGEEQ